MSSLSRELVFLILQFLDEELEPPLAIAVASEMAARLQIPISIRRISFLPDGPSTCPISSSFSFPIPRSSRRPLHTTAPAVYGVSNTRKVSSMAKRRSFFGREETASPVDLQFETPLKIAEYPDPILRRKNKRIQTFDENLKRLVDEMFDIMYKTDGIGLSAPQVGMNVRLMVFNPAGVRGEGEEVVLINPKIFKVSKKIILFDEGCHGKISSEEFSLAIRDTNPATTEEDIKSMMEELDTNRDGSIDMNEFADFFDQKNKKKKEWEGEEEDADESLMEAFKTYDLDGDGFISVQELHTVMMRLQINCSVEDCAKMIEGVDSDGNGKVDFQEFKNMMVTLN